MLHPPKCAGFLKDIDSTVVARRQKRQGSTAALGGDFWVSQNWLYECVTSTILFKHLPCKIKRPSYWESNNFFPVATTSNDFLSAGIIRVSPKVKYLLQQTQAVSVADITGGKKANETSEKKPQNGDSEKGLWRKKGEKKGENH